MSGSTITMKDVVRHQLSHHSFYRAASIAACIAIGVGMFIGLHDLLGDAGWQGVVLPPVLAILATVAYAILWDRLQLLQPLLDNPAHRWKLVGIGFACFAFQVSTSTYQVATAIGGSDAVVASLEDQATGWNTSLAAALDNARARLTLQAGVDGLAGGFASLADREQGNGRLTGHPGPGVVTDTLTDLSRQLRDLSDKLARQKEDVAELQSSANNDLAKVQQVMADPKLSVADKQRQASDIATHLKQTVDRIDSDQVTQEILGLHLGSALGGMSVGTSRDQQRAIAALLDQARRDTEQLHRDALAVRDRLKPVPVIVFHPTTKGQAVRDYFDREFLAWCIPVGLDAICLLVMLTLSVGWRDVRHTYEHPDDPRDQMPKSDPYANEAFPVQKRPDDSASVTPFPKTA